MGVCGAGTGTQGGHTSHLRPELSYRNRDFVNFFLLIGIFRFTSIPTWMDIYYVFRRQKERQIVGDLTGALGGQSRV